ncbi:MAG TPA: response regulator [Verrucomicrobiae bacterium]|jgi:CheY-like chemotaxis protein
MKKILIIEDELVVRSIYRRKFEMSGYKVETAEEGPAALKMLPDFQPDLIQVDIMLPGMDGVEVIRKIRAMPAFSNVPILVLSSFYRPDLAKEAWKAGASKCVSKMDCTPVLALDLVEQLLSGEDTRFTPKYGTIPLPKGALADLPSKTNAVKQPASAMEAPPPWPQEPRELPAPPKLKIDLNLPPSNGAIPSRPTFAQENSGGANGAPKNYSAQWPAGGRISLKSAQMERLSDPGHQPLAAAAAPPPSEPEASEPPPAAGPDFRLEIRQDFLKRVPQIQSELRERVGALIRSKSTTEQLKLLKDLEGSISSLASLAGITGFSRVSHLSGSLDALIKDLNRKPSQMTASVLRTIAHAMDCLNALFRDLSHVPRDVPPSMLILVVDDEPISRRTISVALSKANLRCISLEDSQMALTVLKENPFDLIFLDAEMPGLNGFELCTQLRKLPTNKNTPVIFVTSLTKFETRAQSSLSGGNDLIAKPFLMMELAVKALTYLLKPPVTKASS